MHAPGHTSLGHMHASGCALSLSKSWQEWWNRPTSLQLTGAPVLFCFVFILAVLIFIRADAVFAIAVDKFLASIINCDCPHMQDILRHILFISGEALLFNLAVHLLERAVSLFLFLFSA